MRTKTLLTLAVLMAAAILVVCPAAAGERIVVRVGHVNPAGDPSHDAWEVFKKTLEAKSQGRFAVELYPAG